MQVSANLYTNFMRVRRAKLYRTVVSIRTRTIVLAVLHVELGIQQTIHKNLLEIIEERQRDILCFSLRRICIRTVRVQYMLDESQQSIWAVLIPTNGQALIAYARHMMILPVAHRILCRKRRDKSTWRC